MANGITQKITNKMIFKTIGKINDEMKIMNEKIIPICTIIEPMQKQVNRNTVFRLKTLGALKIIGILFVVVCALLKIFKVI